MSGLSDHATQILAYTREVLLIDPDWSEPLADGFAWWPHQLRQEITATLADGRIRLSASLPILVDIADRVLAMRRLVELMRFPPLSGFILEESSVSLRAQAWIDPGSSTLMVSRFAIAAILQATFAELGFKTLSRMTGGDPALSRHPSSGPRPHPDDMLNLAAAEIHPAGLPSSVWNSPEEFLETARRLVERGGEVTRTGGFLSVRLPFLHDLAANSSPRDTASLQISTSDPHPELGFGLFSRLFLPHSATVGNASAEEAALRLNQLETEALDGPDIGLGSWTLERSVPERLEFEVLASPPRLCYVSFLPNFLFADHVLELLAIDQLKRLAWARRVIRGIA